MKNENWISLLYGLGSIRCQWNPRQSPVTIQASFFPAGNAIDLVDTALTHPVGTTLDLSWLGSDSKIAIAVNDKTRPVPNEKLVMPLLTMLRAHGVPPENITFFIASGTHVPMDSNEFSEILPVELINQYQVIAHNCDARQDLEYIGRTSRGTPVWVCSAFYHSDLRIVVGDIEPHHFAGYSGGVKSAAIGLCGRETITANHGLLLDENSTIGVMDGNPLRLDIEEIGSMIKVDLALNSVLDDQKRIISVFFGTPSAVLHSGIKVIDEMCRIPIEENFDLVISCAGGYPRDINLYQAQKAMTTAAQFCKPGGKLILVAECRDGIGSVGYAQFMKNINTVDGVLDKFRQEKFALGAHKAFLTARIQKTLQTYLYSALSPNLVTSLLYTPLESKNGILDLNDFSNISDRIAILPYATVCMPRLKKEKQ